MADQTPRLVEIVNNVLLEQESYTVEEMAEVVTMCIANLRQALDPSDTLSVISDAIKGAEEFIKHQTLQQVGAVEQPRDASGHLIWDNE